MPCRPGAGRTEGVNAMAARKKKPEQMLENHKKDIQRELAHWHFLRDHGGQDPFWPDGVNMNLTRNHIIYARRQIVEICEENDWALPAEYFLPLPPEVPDGYMANLDQEKRVKRLQQNGQKLTTEKVEYDEKQMRLC